MIQKKYAGVVKNYINGFDVLEKQNFFGTHDKDINKDLMLIDKINLFYKSSKRLPFIFSPNNKQWLGKIDKLKTFDDVVSLAKDLLKGSQECWNCGAKATENVKLKRCQGCSTAYYCKTDCQKKHWNDFQQVHIRRIMLKVVIIVCIELVIVLECYQME